MCAIAGILNLRPGQAPSRPELAKMIATMRHRGPDGYGFYEDTGVGLAHARLSIIDLSTGDQPIHNEDRSVWVVLNGEIFNHVELRRGLAERGHQFYTQSDTEVLVHLYEEKGLDLVHDLNGQFSFVLWDQRRRRLLAARDRVGVRPFHYFVRDDRLVFASEIKALFAQGSLRPEIDPSGIGQVCTYWSTLEGATCFQHVQSLPPACTMVAENGRVSIRRYWDWVFPEQPSPGTLRSEAELLDELRALMTDAVALQLRADVPVGAYLSGGLDSSLLVALIRHHTGGPVRTFSLRFDDAELDESSQQRQVCEFLQPEHLAVTCTKADIAAIFPRLIRHAETALVRTAPAPLMMLSDLVRASGLKVVLTGEGADEVFGGYDLFKEAKIRRFWARQPNSRWRPLLLKRLYPYLRHSPVASAAFAQRFFAVGDRRSPCFAHLPRWSTTRRIWTFFTQDTRAQIRSDESFSDFTETLPVRMQQWAPLGRDQYVEAHTLLTGYLLSSQGDRVSAANSVEGRVPYLDHRVIEFANRLPVGLKVRGLTEKYLLRKLARGLIPESVRARVKQPYRAPDSESFFRAGRLVGYAAELLSEPSLRDAGLFEPQAVSMLVEKCAAGRALGFSDNMAFVAILSTMLLHEQFVEARSI